MTSRIEARNPWYVFIFHGAVATQYAYTIVYDWMYVDIPESVTPIVRAFGYKWKFYTYWNLNIQLCYFLLCAYIDLVGNTNNNGERRSLVKFKDYVEASLAFPTAMSVTLTYWALTAVDPNLIIPKEIMSYIPMWLNHVVHTNVTICQLLEVANKNIVYPRRSDCLTGLVIFNTVYIVWFHIVKAKSGLWAYPIFDTFNCAQRSAFVIGMFLFTGVLYTIGEKLHALCGGRFWNDRGQRPILK